MRESDHDCVHPREDFIYVDLGTDTPAADDPATPDAVAEKNKSGGLDSLGGGRLE